MQYIGNAVLYLVMVCAVIGAIAAIINDKEGLGREFLEGLYSIGPIFVPVAGIMASIPILSRVIEGVVGPLFQMMGADTAVAATAIIAVDMGGYQLAHGLAASPEVWVMATIIGYMSGATIVFSIPVGLAMLPKKDHPYFALGIMAGILSIPIGVACSLLSVAIFQPMIRADALPVGDASYKLLAAWGSWLPNFIPLVVFVIILAYGLWKKPDLMIKLFMIFGRVMDAAIKLVLVFSIVEYFTQVFSYLFGSWGLDPIIADKENTFRALEIAGYIGIMLSGAFPLVYLLQKILRSPLERLGQVLGLERVGAAGLLASSANILAMFRLIPQMRPRDKVINVAYGVCAAFLLGDHLAFTANFQPTLMVPVLSGKFLGGVAGIAIAFWISVPKAELIAKSQE